MILKKIFSRPVGIKESYFKIHPSTRKRFNEKVSNGCGVGGGWMNKFLDRYLYGKQFKAICHVHDFNTRRGGNIIDFLETQFVMWAKQVEDSFDQRDIVMFLLATFVYLFGLMIGGWFFFHWGDYRSLDEIMKTV